jgi:hypothetical protein
MRSGRLAIEPFSVGFYVKRMTPGFKVPASAVDLATTVTLFSGIETHA